MKTAAGIVLDIASERGVSSTSGFAQSGEYRRALGIAKEPNDGLRARRIAIAVDDYRKRTAAEAVNTRKAEEAARAAG